MQLKVKQVEAILRGGEPGAYSDGAGLRLLVSGTGAASWQYRYQLAGKRRVMGLGSAHTLSLADARGRAHEARVQVSQGLDPLEVKSTQEDVSEGVQAPVETFKQLALQYIEAHRANWRNAKHGHQWQNTLTQYAFPVIGNKTADQVTTDDVLKVLKPIWSKTPETASRVRSRMELVLDAAKAQGLRQGENPARWRGHLDKLLPKRKKSSIQHHPAMPYPDIPVFFAKLMGERQSPSSRALVLTILTACRTSEVLLATWDEFDLKRRVWTIPATRMKAETEHRVPLSEQAMHVLESLSTYEKQSGYLFPGQRMGKPLSNMAMMMVLRKLGYGHLTVHGFRSTFRDWAAECTSYANIVAEQALAHTVGGVEGAYRRGDLLDKRRGLMQDWATFCVSEVK